MSNNILTSIGPQTAVQDLPRSSGGQMRESAPTLSVSVIVPAYKVAPYIAETLDSVLAQTFRDFEIIVINDGSPDTPELKKALAPYLKKIIYIEQENKGAASSRNAGILVARGEWIAFLDGDDVWLPDYLAQQIGFLNESGNEMVYCDAHIFGDVKKKETYMQRSPSKGKLSTEGLLGNDCNVITSGTVVSRKRVVECGMFDEGPSIRIEDFELWFRLLKTGTRADYQRKVLLKYRVREGSLSGNHMQRAERSLIALDEIKSKQTLTPAEEAAWQRQYDRADRNLNTVKGKAFLIQRNYADALNYFRIANRPPREFKMTLITLLVQYVPPIALWLFRTFRPDEFSSF